MTRVAGSSPRDCEFSWGAPAAHVVADGAVAVGDASALLSAGRSLGLGVSFGSLGFSLGSFSLTGSVGPLGSEPLPPPAGGALDPDDVFSLPVMPPSGAAVSGTAVPHWLDAGLKQDLGMSTGITRMKSLDAYANDDDSAAVVLPVAVTRSPGPVGSLAPLVASGSTVRAPVRTTGRKRARSSVDDGDVALPVGASGAPPAGAPLDEAPRNAKAQRRTLRGAFAGATQGREVRALPPPPTFFSTATKLTPKRYGELLAKLKGLEHGPPNKKLGKYYGARDWCCERCRNIFKDHTKPFKRPEEDVRSVLRKLRLQSCVDVGMRGYASGESRCTMSCCSRPDTRDACSSAVPHDMRTDASGNSSNHNSKTTPLASEHPCAAAVRAMQLLQMVAPAPSAAAAAPGQQ